MIGQRIASIQKGIYLFPEFLPGALCCFSTREFDASEDIPRFLKAIGIREDRFFTIDQVHGDVVLLASSPSSELPAADGIVTSEKDLALIIRTADCLPVFFYDPETPAIGLCHAGWRGAQKGIVFETLESLKSHFGTDPASLQVAIGPAICEGCYEVGEEFENYFPAFVRREGSRFFFNLAEAVKRQLVEGGVPPASIRDSSFCTACSVDQFFSARKEGVETGRLISVAVLK